MTSNEGINYGQNLQRKQKQTKNKQYDTKLTTETETNKKGMRFVTHVDLSVVVFCGPSGSLIQTLLVLEID
jgi:hypothetical protein